MTTEELLEKLELIQKLKCETSTLEIKSAEKGCPKHLYDSLSSFSNQDDGGTIVFGVDEKQNFKEVGVYDPQDIQKKINEQCLQMEPIVRPLLTMVEKDNKFFVSAEIPGVDLVERPVFYKGRGRVKGSYIRIGDSDEPMTEYEVYSYEAYRKKYQDEADAKNDVNIDGDNELVLFCRTPRTRKEICDYLGLSSVTYAIQTHVMPLVETGKIKMSNPDKPKSPKQLFYSE